MQAAQERVSFIYSLSLQPCSRVFVDLLITVERNRRQARLDKDPIKFVPLRIKRVRAVLGKTDDALHSVEHFLCHLSVSLRQGLGEPNQALNTVKLRLRLRDLLHQLLPAALLVEDPLRVRLILAGLLLFVELVAHLDLLEGHVEDVAERFFVSVLHLLELHRIDWLHDSFRVRVDLLELKQRIFPSLLHDLRANQVLPREEKLLFKSGHLGVCSMILDFNTAAPGTAIHTP